MTQPKDTFGNFGGTHVPFYQVGKGGSVHYAPQASDPTSPSPTNGSSYYNTVINKYKRYLNGGWYEDITNVNYHTEETNPDPSIHFFALWDANTGTHKKTKVIDIPGLVAAIGIENENPGKYFIGTIMDYPSSGTLIANEVIYLRNYLTKDTALTKMEFFPTNTGAASKVVSMGIYDQSVPTEQDFTVAGGKPNNLVAQVTPFAANTVTPNEFNQIALTSTYVVPNSGFYWFAYHTTGGGGSGIKPAGTSTVYVAGCLPIYVEGGPTSLPATANPDPLQATGALYFAAVE